jgi:hypothetical protein
MGYLAYSDASSGTYLTNLAFMVSALMDVMVKEVGSFCSLLVWLHVPVCAVLVCSLLLDLRDQNSRSFVRVVAGVLFRRLGARD